jgi:prolyl oligopeptidase
MPCETVADFETWLRRMQAMPAYLDAYGERLRRAAAEKRTQPRAVMERVLEPLARQVVDDPADSPFFDRFRSFPDAIPAAERDRLTAEAKQVIADAVIPAYRRFQSVFRDEYLPATRETVGLWDTPDGREHYRFLARYHTTTELTPEQIHAIGLKEVARNRAEMQQVMDEVGFEGSLAEFFEHLRTDPQFYYKTGDELFRAYAYIVKMIDPELPKLFGKLYRTPFGLRPIPDNSAPNTTTAYYSGPSLDGTRPGYYYVNLYRPEVRPKYEMEVLSVHEAAPGHHLQIALAQEQTDLPMFRRAGGYTAYIEGWGLYSERLGYDLGLYKDPYSRFGQLTYDQWRAVRLVVDTGLHYLGWTRQQAIDYFMANAAKTEADIVNEIDRYISDPGQALAYKIGQLKFLELRARAEQALGNRYDIRAFHDTVLATGAVPLDILERTVDDWIAARKGE